MYNRRESKPCFPPLGLAYIAGYLRAQGHTVQIYDMIAEHYDKEQFFSYNDDVKREENERCLVDDYQYPLSNVFIEYGMDSMELQRRLLAFTPDFVGISCITSSRHFQAVEVVKLCKTILPTCITLMGGNHPSSMPELVLKDCGGALDYCVVGEGEVVFGEICANFPYPKGIVIAKQHLCIDELPLPAHDLLPLDKYMNIWNRSKYHYYPAQKFVIMNTSRGCAHGCEHCPHEVVFGAGWRKRSLESIEKELQFVISLGVKEVQFHEYNGFMSRQYMWDIALLMKKYNLVWNVPIGVWIKVLDEPFIKHLKECGMNCIDLAIESPNKDILCTMPGKNVDIDHALKVIQWCKDAKLYINGFFMIGFPEQTLKDMWNTVIWARSLDLDSVSIFIAQPLPKTKLWNKATFIDGFHPFMLRYGKCNTSSPLWKPEQVENIRYQGRLMCQESSDKIQWGVHTKV